jgi:hypothetical protein
MLDICLFTRILLIDMKIGKRVSNSDSIRVTYLMRELVEQK